MIWANAKNKHAGDAALGCSDFYGEECGEKLAMFVRGMVKASSLRDYLPQLDQYFSENPMGLSECDLLDPLECDHRCCDALTQLAKYPELYRVKFVVLWGFWCVAYVCSCVYARV